MYKLMWSFLLFALPLLLAIAVIIEVSYEQGYKVGRATQPTLLEKVQLVQDTDQMCTQWLFNANIKDVRKRMCGR